MPTKCVTTVLTLVSDGAMAALIGVAFLYLVFLVLTKVTERKVPHG